METKGFWVWEVRKGINIVEISLIVSMFWSVVKSRRREFIIIIINDFIIVELE